MEKTLQNRFLLYALLSAVSFTYLVLPENAGVSVPIFILLQFAFMYWICPKKKPLWLFIPIFILALNSFISGNTMWRIPNFIVTMFLYSMMVLLMIDRFPVANVSLEFLRNTFENMYTPLRHFILPIQWCSQINKEKTKYIQRVLIGVGISLPCILFLIVMLSSADAVFDKGTLEFFQHIWDFTNFNFVFKAIYGVLVGLYLFGMLYITCVPPKEAKAVQRKSRNGDLLIFNILLFSILSIYTMFVIIQFRYLFAGEQLPYGLNYTDYARKGFFELLFLSGLNILLILVTVNFTKEKQGIWAKITKGLCSYLCCVTIIMLVSSFYRMWLYNSEDGLTRLRLLVFGFLIFESIGLVITFFYIIRPKFNIVAVYLGIGLTYYLILNLVPIDYIIAENQISRYYHNEKYGMEYVITLSTDAAPQIAKLLKDNEADENVKVLGKQYFENLQKYYGDFVPRWQRYNLSVDGAIKNVK